LFGFACFSNEYLSAFASFNGFVLSHGEMTEIRRAQVDISILPVKPCPPFEQTSDINVWLSLLGG